MFSRDDLYYEGQDLGDTYLDTPGILQVNRLLNQQSGIFLQVNATLPVMHKRTIVINDWGDEFNNKESLLYQYITLLLDEGFTIYQIQAFRLFPILNVRDLGTLPSSILNQRDVYRLLNNHNLEKKKVYLLDHDKIVKLCNEFSQKDNFDFKNFMVFSFIMDEKDEYREKSNRSNLVLTSKEQVQAFVDERIRRLALAHFWDESVLGVCNPNNLTALRLEDVPVSELKHLVSVTPNVNAVYYRPYSLLISLDVFTHTPQLETLIIQKVPLADELSNEIELNTTLPNLKRLILINLTLNATDLEVLLQHLPNLETLQLHWVDIHGEFKALNIKSLKSLNITSGTMSNTVISSLVNQSPDLNILEINVTQKKALEFEPKQALRLLKLSKISIHAKSLEALCSETLVHLELSAIQLKGELALPHSLKRLVKLTTDRFVPESDKTWDNLSKKAPNMLELVLTGDWQDCLAPKFPNVQTFEILGKLVNTKEQAIETLQTLHRLAPQTQIIMQVGDELMKYRQAYALQEQVGELTVDNIPNNHTMSVIQACPWIKTIRVGWVNSTVLWDIENHPSRKWIIATPIKVTSRSFAEWKSMEIHWNDNMTIQIDDCICRCTYDMQISRFQLDVTGKISAEDFSLFALTFPKNSAYNLKCHNLDIVGETKTLPALQVDKAFVDQSSWNKGLFYLLQPKTLILKLEHSDTIKANEAVQGFQCTNIPNQKTLTTINNAFTNLNSMFIQETIFDNFELSTTNRFKLSGLFINHKTYKNTGLQAFIQQYPKLKHLYISTLPRTLLLDFKKYCPNLETIQLQAIKGILKVKDITYLVNALPIGCKIELDSCSLSLESKYLITQYPQIAIINSSVRSYETQKPLVSDFKPYDPTPSTLDPNWNQGMLINRLIAYLELLDPANRKYTPKLKKGICVAVSKWFADTVEQKGVNVWNAQWKIIKFWDKQALPPHDSKLGITLEELKTYVFNYQFLSNAELGINPSKIITNDLNQFLNAEPNKPLFICNAWHRTCLIYQDKQWLYFDPNYKYGEPRHFSTKEGVVQEILRVVGCGLSIISYDESLKPCWSQDQGVINAFFEAGGFGVILTKPEEMEGLQIKPLNQQALEGLFLLNTNNVPFWYFGLTQRLTDSPIQVKTLNLLARYAKKTSDEHLEMAITKGMSYLSEELRKALKASLSEGKTLTKYVDLIIKCIDDAPLPIPEKDRPWLPEKRGLEPTDFFETDSMPEPLISKKSAQVTQSISSQDLNTPITLTLNHPFVLSLAYANYQKNPTPPMGNSPFKTWEMATLESFESLLAFDYFLSKHHKQNLLLHIPSNTQVVNYLHHLQASELMKARKLFVINSFDDLHCAISTITVDSTGKGIIKPPNSGPLYDFLIENAACSPIIAVNWSNFTTQQLIQANTLIDKHRQVDRVPLPKGSIVLGLQNPKSPKAYLGSDFSSRHTKLYELPQNLNIIDVDLPTLGAHTNAQDCVIELYGENNWEAYFYGHWTLTEKGFFFEKSALLQALEKKPEALHIVLNNAPFDNPDFAFALNSLVSQGYCTVNGQRFELPKNRGISLRTGYNFEALFAQTVISMERGYLSSDDDCVVNIDALPTLFENYQIIQDTKALITLSGLLQHYANKTISLCLTAPLPLGAYARLLVAAKRYNTTIKLKVAPEVTIPEKIKPFMTETTPIRVSEPSPTRLVVSNDLHYTEKMLQKEKPFDRVIDISEESKDTLLYTISGQLTGDKPIFNETVSDLWHALMNNNRVLLKGHFPQTVIDALANLFKPEGGIYHNGEWEKPTGELVLLTESEKNFSFVSQIDKVEVSLDNKLDLLGPNLYVRLLEKYEKQDLSALSYAYLVELAQTQILPDKPDGLITPLLQLPDMPFIDEDFRLEEEQSRAFQENRKANVLGALHARPTVFLSGETAVGKSSFMHDLEQDPLISVTFNDIEAWLQTPKTNTINILFIDEANLIKTDWLCFEGLYSTPPSLFYKGLYYPLDDTFKVVFAGNPANYSTERRLPKLFQNHPNCVVFGAMSNAYLYHQVLKPILGDNKDIARIFLKTFQAVKKMNKDAISARELQMMAYLFQAQNKPEDVTEKAKIIAFNMACQVLAPQDKFTFNDWFVKAFGELKPELEKMPKGIGRFSSKAEHPRRKKMLVTSSHYEVYHGLDAFMTVRHLKQQWHGQASFGGLSGFVLEGEPGIGKSYFVKEFLLDNGFYEEKIDEANFATFDYEALKRANLKPSPHFYYLPASLHPLIKIDLLNKAFHEGAVVVIDEINASDALEELMNALLMGEDLKGRRALVPGFSLIGTQNPSSMEGRERASLASARRVMHYNFPTYTPEEMVEVLMHKGLGVEKACAFVFDFLCHQYYARKVNLNPEPCFRDVLREAKKFLKTQNLNTIPYQIQLPLAETVLMSHLNVNNQNHKDLILHMQSIGYEKFFYIDKDNKFGFLPDMQGDLKQALEDMKTEKNHPTSTRYAKDSFFSANEEAENEKSPIATFPKTM